MFFARGHAAKLRHRQRDVNGCVVGGCVVGEAHENAGRNLLDSCGDGGACKKHLASAATRLTPARVEKPWGQGHLDAESDALTRLQPEPETALILCAPARRTPADPSEWHPERKE